MTEIKLGKSLTRKTAVTVQHKPLVVTLHAGYMELRRAGTRTVFSLSYERAYIQAAERAAQLARAEKLAAKKAKCRK